LTGEAIRLAHRLEQTMNATTPGVSPLRQRMLDDMRMRKPERKTQTCYIRAVRRLTMFLGRSPDTATVEDLRRFQMHLVDAGASPITINATLSGLKFFFRVTLSRGEIPGEGASGARATNSASGSESRRGRAPDRSSAEPEASHRIGRGIWSRTARQ
jgi:hypothetical protein